MVYRDALIEAIDHWSSEVIEDEWFFENFRHDFIGKMSAIDAYLHLDETIELLLKEKDESTLCEILQTIITLARRSKTTEIPNRLSNNKENIAMKFQGSEEYTFSKYKELIDYYRMK